MRAARELTAESKRKSSGAAVTSHRAGFVTILGRPNGGKSTLLNAMLGAKLAIVASKPQTTRTSIQGVLTLPEAQVVFVDTPGIHRQGTHSTDTLLNKHMMASVRSAADGPDVVLFVVDTLAPFSDRDAEAVDLVKKTGVPALAVFNKVDWLDDKTRVLALIDRYRTLHDFAAYVPVSALKRDGLDVLLREIIGRLPEGPALYPADYLTDQPERFLAAEIVREKILHLTQQEVPHSVAVMIESWQERPTTGKAAPEKGRKDSPPLLHIAATIYVERPGQKSILIGAGGAVLKKIGTLARQELEQILARKVFLETFVKVRPRWRDDPQFLAAIDWRGPA